MPTEIELLKQYGLFVTMLNNGDWMVGRCNCFYSMDVGADHCQDKRLAIHSILAVAIDTWIAEHGKELR